MTIDGKRAVCVRKHVFLEENAICRSFVYRFEDGTMKTINEHYPMKEVSKEECLKIRRETKRGIFIKRNEKIFYAQIPKKLISLAIGLTNPERQLCQFCYNYHEAQKVQKGECDCKKEIDMLPIDEIKDGSRWQETTRRLEKYPFIEFGCEAFNLKEEDIGVFKCKNFSGLFYPEPYYIVPIETKNMN